MSKRRYIVNTPGLRCRVIGPALDGEGQGVRDYYGRPVFGYQLKVALDGEQLHDCTAVYIGADGVTGVVRRQTRDDEGRYIYRNDEPKRLATHTERGQIEVWVV